ncbi:MAG: DNA polymerase III subunit beta [Oscillospiraceae bacterium]|nr:DNA polymerase III subunit beta [Oscillospiraceae bacterium]
MKIRCEKKDLQIAVNNVSRAAPSKSPIPALEGILFEANRDGLKLTAYDTRIGIYTTLDCSVLEGGCIVIPARFLGELVRRLPDGMVSIEADESFATTIRCGKSEFHVMGLDPESFPELNVVDAVQNIGIPENILKNMINQTIFSVSTSESRPLYMGVLFEVGNSDLTLVAVDGYRLAKRSEQMENANMNPCTFVIPGASLSEVERLCSADKTDEVMIALGDKHASFEIGNTVLITRRLEGEFMNYRKSIPSTFRYEIIVERDELIRVIDRISLVIKDKQTSPVKMVVEQGELQFYCTTPFGHAEDSCLCEGSGDGMRIGFNDRYFMDALKAASDEKVRVSMNTPSAPIVIEGAEGSSYLYMVLPVRLRDND